MITLMINNFNGRRPRLQVGRSQLDLYLEEPALELNMKSDVLGFGMEVL